MNTTRQGTAALPAKRLEVWMKPADELRMDEAIVKLRDAGNEVLYVDHPNRKILVAIIDRSA